MAQLHCCHSLLARVEQRVVQRGVLSGILMEAPLHGVHLAGQVDLKRLPGREGGEMEGGS